MARLVYTDEWRRAAADVEERLRADGFAVSRDAVGNIFGRLEGRDGGRVIATGSHLDTAVQGGRYDGTAGVVCSYVALRALLRAYGRPRRTLELVVVSDEESSRFPSNLWGSRAINGRIDPSEVDTLRDADGVTVAEALRECGLDPAAAASAARDDIEIFLELHIEQGPTLEREGIPVGIVSAITGFECAEHVVTGESNHAGGTPLALRRDPMQGAAEMTLAVDAIARALGEAARATVGRVEAFPGAMNIIPSRVTFTTDLRHPDPGALRELVARVGAALPEIAARRSLGLSSTVLVAQPPVPMDAELVSLLDRSAAGLGLQRLSLHSGGGHDAMIFALAGVRTGLLFVPSVRGLSHSPDEYTDAQDLAAGTRVLAETLRALAY
jgi:allantoate deiminase